MPDVDHQVAFAQFQKAVDYATEPPTRRATQIGAAEQLAAAEQHDLLGHQPKTALQRADRKEQAALSSGLGRTENIAQTPYFGLGLADDKNLLTGRSLVEFVADAVDITAKALDRLDFQSAGRFQRSGGHRRSRYRRKMKYLLENIRYGMEGNGRHPLSLWERLNIHRPLSLRERARVRAGGTGIRDWGLGIRNIRFQIFNFRSTRPCPLTPDP